MFGKINSLRGLARLEVKSDMPESFLNNCAELGITVLSAVRTDALSLEVLIPASMLKEAKAIALKSRCELKVLGSGGGRRMAGLLRRRIFPAALVFCLVGLLFWSKFYVWEIELSGNETVPTGKILDALSECGVKSGAFWPSFSADNIRSEVLFRIPELSWITVNMRGSLAEVIAVERSEPPEMVFEGECADIVADKDGFVTAVDPLVGQSMVKPGAAVRKGDILISGAVESSFSPPRFLRSYGSVEAETNTEFLAVLPEKEEQRHYTGVEKKKFALVIGNKRINFYSGSSISDAFCDKIISVWDLALPEFFELPITVVCETLAYYESREADVDGFEAGDALQRCTAEALARDMGEGELISEKLSFASDKGLLIASLRVRCREEIGILEPISEARRAETELKYTQKADDNIWQKEE